VLEWPGLAVFTMASPIRTLKARRAPFFYPRNLTRVPPFPRQFRVEELMSQGRAFDPDPDDSNPETHVGPSPLLLSKGFWSP